MNEQLSCWYLYLKSIKQGTQRSLRFYSGFLRTQTALVKIS